MGIDIEKLSVEVEKPETAEVPTAEATGKDANKDELPVEFLTESMRRAHAAGWLRQLRRGPKVLGYQIASTASNLDTILRNDAVFKDLWVMDTFSQKAFVKRKPVFLPGYHFESLLGDDGPEDANQTALYEPRLRELLRPLIPDWYFWSEEDDVLNELRIYLDEEYKVEFPLEKLRLAVQNMLSRNKVHMVKEYFTALAGKWDGVNRLDSWLIDHLGVDDTSIIRSGSRKWMLGIVRRVLEAAKGHECAHPLILILEGSTGKGKSQSLKILGFPWFCDEDIDITGRDGKAALQGVLLYELAEKLPAGGNEVVNAFVSRTRDKYRPPYARANREFIRQTSFGATTHNTEYLPAGEGTRRYLPVQVTKRMDLFKFVEERNQMWAEAYHRVAVLGEDHLLDESEVEAVVHNASGSQNQDALIPYVKEILNWGKFRELVKSDCLQSEDILRVLPKHLKDNDQEHLMRTPPLNDARVGRVLKHLGFEKRQYGGGPKRGQRRYVIDEKKPLHWASTEYTTLVNTTAAPPMPPRPLRMVSDTDVGGNDGVEPNFNKGEK
jgi:hypothetical protein